MPNDLVRRVYKHKQKLSDGFTKKYNTTWLVYYEVTSNVEAAIVREKQLKGWRRSKKMALVECYRAPFGKIVTCQYKRLTQGLHQVK